MSAPVIVWIRPGFGFVAPAAASARRVEAALGRQADVNSTYRDCDKQMSMYLAWTAYVNGTGPHPPHSRAIHPKYSKHCQGLAWDTDDWRTPGFIDVMAAHGWIRTAASDPTERHHFEYQWWNDRHRSDPTPATQPHPITEEEDDMSPIYARGTGNGNVYEIRAGKKRKLTSTEWAIIKAAHKAAGEPVPYSVNTVTHAALAKLPDA